MTVPTIFSKIISKEIPASIVYEDDEVLAFNDISPQAPVHVLVIPKLQVKSVYEATSDVLGKLLVACNKVADITGIADTGYRIVTNIGDDGGQTVYHLHFHVLGGRSLNWPPG
jgi:histidine triad (HIT) family protein